MQKHEREALLAAREEAAKLSDRLTLSTRTGARAKLRLIMSGPKGERSHTLSSSPSCHEDCAVFARRWVKRVASEVL